LYLIVLHTSGFFRIQPVEDCNLPDCLNEFGACVGADFFADLFALFPLRAYSDFDQFMARQRQFQLGQNGGGIAWLADT
jgi:hypothetical protein